MNENIELPSIEHYQVSTLSSDFTAIQRYSKLLHSSAQSESGKLRLIRHRYWLQAALASIFDHDSTENICRFWSQKADELIKTAWQLSGLDQENITLVALGKLGAQELNLSSDIDIMLISEKPATTNELQKYKVFHSLLSEVNEYGFCFRVDTNLRPGGRLGPLISSVQQLEDYYWTQGATWERLSLIRIRPICGNKQLINEILKITSKFTYRKFLDYTLFYELKNLRTRIQDQYPANTNVFNLKLSPGGIRDIELFVHALQVIHGGRSPQIRTSSTSHAIINLVREKVLPAGDGDFLLSTYWFYRNLENHAQLINDQQTYLWSFNFPSEKFKIVQDKIIDFSLKTNDLVSDLIGPVQEPEIKIPFKLKDQLSWLEKLGFDSESLAPAWIDLISQTAKSSRGQKDEQARLTFLSLFIHELALINNDKNLGLSLLVDFVKSIRAKASFFTLLNREPKLIRDLVAIFSSSPYLGGIIASRPELVDSFIYRQQTLEQNDFSQLLEDLTERRLLSEIICAGQFIQHNSIQELTSNLSDTADEISLALLKKIKIDYPKSNINLLCLGKWGGRELGLRSDLDFIFITPNAPNEYDHKVAKRFLSRLSDQHRGGQLYNYDLRLRPSGTSGPLLVNTESLLEYIKKKASAWERQSYLKARPLMPTSFNVQSTIIETEITSHDLSELKKIRKQLNKKNTDTIINLKFAPGGLIDIEFAAQIAVLEKKILIDGTSTTAMIKKLLEIDSKWVQFGGTQLLQTYNSLRVFEQLLQIKSSYSGSEINLQSDSTRRLADSLKIDSLNLKQQICNQLEASHKILKNLDPINRPI